REAVSSDYASIVHSDDEAAHVTVERADVDKTALLCPHKTMRGVVWRKVADDETAVDLLPEAGEGDAIGSDGVAAASDVHHHPSLPGPDEGMVRSGIDLTVPDDDSLVTDGVSRAGEPAECAQIDHAGAKRPHERVVHPALDRALADDDVVVVDRVAEAG